jgi:YVTN family beta-propeller protein
MKNKFIQVVIMFALIASSAQSQSPYAHDRVYTANQVSNTVSVVDPANNVFLGEIRLGKPYPDVLSPLYKGQALVHGLRYSQEKKMLAVVSIGSNALTLISTESNQVIKTIYLGRSPHEPTYTPDSKQIWVSVRGEAYVSVIDLDRMAEIKRVPVSDGPGMITFTPDGKLAYVCSSFTPVLEIVNTSTYQVIKRIPVVSPFSPNIFTSPQGDWIALTHKDVGKVTVINTASQSVYRVINTGAITNHVTFATINHTLFMLVTVGGENKVRVFDVSQDFKQTDSIQVGELPHGIWPSADGKLLYVGLEYGDEVQGIDLLSMKPMKAVHIGQSPQALIYADNAVTDIDNRANLSPLQDTAFTQVVTLTGSDNNNKATGRISIRSIGLTDLVEQIFNSLDPNTSYTLALTRSSNPPFKPDYEINTFVTDARGHYAGQSTGLVKKLNNDSQEQDYHYLILIENGSTMTILANKK